MAAPWPCRRQEARRGCDAAPLLRRCRGVSRGRRGAAGDYRHRPPWPSEVMTKTTIFIGDLCSFLRDDDENL